MTRLINGLKQSVIAAVLLAGMLTAELSSAQERGSQLPAAEEKESVFICGNVSCRKTSVKDAEIRLKYTDGSQPLGSFDYTDMIHPDADGHFVLSLPPQWNNERLCWLEIKGEDFKTTQIRLSDLERKTDLDIQLEVNWILVLVGPRYHVITEIIELESHSIPGSYYTGRDLDRLGGMNVVFKDLMPACNTTGRY